MGSEIVDPECRSRIWSVQGFYSPIVGRALGGLRLKLVDLKGFVGFVNQRDAEVLLGIASPGTYCRWLGTDYAGPGDPGWVGLCADEEDLHDDLFERELLARSDFPPGSVLPSGLEMTRRIHGAPREDFEELMTLLWDADPRTGSAPDLRFESLEFRWKSVERTPTRLRARLWHMV